MPSLALLLAACGHHPGTAADSAAVDSCATGGACETYSVDAPLTDALPPSVPLPSGAVDIAVGDLEGSGVDQVYVGTHRTVTRLDGDGWADATDMWTQPDDVDAHPLIADLTGDGAADLVIGLPNTDDRVGQVLLFAGPLVDPVTWDTPHLELKGQVDESHTAGPLTGSGVWAADADGDGILDLVVKASGRTWIRPGPIQSSTPLGAEGDVQWVDSDDARQQRTAVGDVDGDGTTDLAFLVGPSDAACGDAYEVWVATGPFSPGTSDLSAVDIVLSPPPLYKTLAAIDLVDVDGDGALDVLADAGSALYWPGPPATGQEATRVPSAFGPVGIGDFDGDAVPDLLELNLAGAGPWDTGAEALVTVTDGPASSWAARDPCAVTASRAWTGWPIELADAAWVGDLDGDGRADAVIAASAAQVILGGG